MKPKPLKMEDIYRAMREQPWLIRSTVNRADDPKREIRSLFDGAPVRPLRAL